MQRLGPFYRRAPIRQLMRLHEGAESIGHAAGEWEYFFSGIAFGQTGVGLFYRRRRPCLAIVATFRGGKWVERRCGRRGCTDHVDPRLKVSQ